MSTLKEPYRIEGKKTMGYEVAEQMDWELPDAIFYPTGGGVGMIGMWKAFGEMEKLGWIGSRRPKMIAVQAEGCQPVVRAFEENEPRSRFFEGAHTIAAGLRVPKPLGDVLTLEAVRESGGTALAVSDEEMLEAGVQLASLRGHLCGAGRRGVRGGGVQAAGVGIPEGERPHRPLQHRLRAEVSGGLFHAFSAHRRGRAGQAGRPDYPAVAAHSIEVTMKDLALAALDAAARRGVDYADVRAIETRDREIVTKNGKAAHVGGGESQGLGIRVLAYGCWGFAATDDLSADRHGSLRGAGAGDCPCGHGGAENPGGAGARGTA